MLEATDATLTIEPAPRANIPGNAALHTRNMLVTLTSHDRRQSSSVQSRIDPWCTQPAAFTTTSKAISSAKRAVTALGSVTSKRRASAPAIDATVSASMSVATTRAPSATKRSAVARPMPAPAAVTRQALPCRRPLMHATLPARYGAPKAKQMPDRTWAGASYADEREQPSDGRHRAHEVRRPGDDGDDRQLRSGAAGSLLHVV